MKKVIILVLILISLFACDSTPSKTDVKKEKKKEEKIVKNSEPVILKEEAVNVEIHSDSLKERINFNKEPLEVNKLSVCAGNGRYWFFRADTCWKKTYGSSHNIGAPLLIRKTFKTLPGNIDAACYINGAYWFFKGSKCWKKKYGKDVYDEGSIEKAWGIKSKFLGNGIDAVCGMNDRYWFFIGNQCWKKTYGKKISGPFYIKDKWKNIPSVLCDGVEAVCAINDRYWFFKGDDCWKKPFGKDVYHKSKMSTWIDDGSIKWNLEQDEIVYLDTEDILLKQHDINTESVIDINTAIDYKKTFSFHESYINSTTLTFKESLDIETSFDFSTKFPLLSSSCSVKMNVNFASEQQIARRVSKDYRIDQTISFKGPKPAFKVIGYIDIIDDLEKKFDLFVWVSAKRTNGFGARRTLSDSELLDEIKAHFNGEIIDSRDPKRVKIKLSGVLKANIGISTGIKTVEI